MVNTNFENSSTSTVVGKESVKTNATMRYCCFVVPCRLALIGLIAVLLICSIILAAVGLVIVNNFGRQLLELERLALFFHIFISFLVTLFSLIGLFAAARRNASFTSLFASMMLGEFIFGIAAGALCLYLLFRPATDGDPGLGTYRQCMDVVFAQPDNSFLRNVCERSTLMKGLSVSFYIFLWFIQLVVVIVANQYVIQLHEEAAEMEILQPPTREGRESFYC